jgi:hypothetical protein
MKLTTEQIEYVENYIISKDIKWYELQVELTDHMVTSMEGFGKTELFSSGQTICWKICRRSVLNRLKSKENVFKKRIPESTMENDN